jgi:hypothetical protein
MSSPLRSTVAAALVSLVVNGMASRPAEAQSGSFAPTNPLLTPRSQHTATLLPNGRVLVTGGVQSASLVASQLLASAELYDPASGRFSKAANMTTSRRLHTATVLPDGRVLIVGGYGGGDSGWGTPLTSAELYDPSSDRFTRTGDLITARGGHTAVPLPTGQVLILGDSGTFSGAGAYVGRGACDFCAPSVALADGAVLFPGQYPAQLYDVGTNEFSPTGMMLEDHSAAALLLNGTVLLAGGASDFGRSAAAELYDPATGSFSATGSMAARRVEHTLTLLPSGLVLVAGGETDACAGSRCSFAGTVSSAELYDPAARVFHATGDMTAAHGDHTATLLADGRVLIAGGVAYGGIGLFYGSESTAEIYQPDVLIPAPTVLGVTGDAHAQGAIYHAGTRYLAGPDDPAAAGDEVDVLCENVGSGSTVMPQVAIGGRLARIVSTADAPGVAGARSFRVIVPRGVVAGSVAVRVTYLGRSSNVVTMPVK